MKDVHNFDETPVKLNPRQLQVVSHKQGPLLVVAGAGTGKTRVIVEKINALLDEGVDASAILALTFTEKAAAEMLDRVLMSHTGLQPDIAITTFNGYGESLLREFSSHIGLGRNFLLLNDQARIVFVRERISEFKLDYFMPLTSVPDAIIEDILRLFSQAKQHLVTPEALLNYAQKLPASNEAERLEKRQYLELGNAYECYVRLCRQENVIDYDDQIFLVTQLLQQRPNIRKQLQTLYHTLFIDEFQDTNPMQSRLVDLLVGKTQNIIAVGDDDQSIYGFRGATLSNILGFKDRYPQAREVALTENFRSSQAILDAAYSLIQHNNPNRLESTLKINKRLIGQLPGVPPQLKRFNQQSDELDWLAADIETRIAAGETPGSIAVLTRSRQTARLVHEALERTNVPHKLIGYSQDLYKQPVVRMLTELCRTLAEPQNNESLHHTLTSDLFGIPNEQVAPMATKARYEHELLEDLLTNTQQPEITKALELIASWREQAAAMSVGRLLFRAIDESGYKDRLMEQAATDEETGLTIQSLGQYFDTLRAFESIANQPTATQYLVSLPALKAAGESTEDGTLDIALDEVSVMTVHKAKGLEWDTVYIPACTEMAFPSKNQARGLQLPNALKAISASLADEHYSEERRLMYVAATRARSNLIVSFSDHGKSMARRKPSRFIDEMFGAGTAEAASVTNVGNQQQSLLEMPAILTQKITIPSHIYDGQQVRLSVSQAATLLECPLNFYYKYVLRAPEDPSPSAAYGTQLHNLFQPINEAKRDGRLEPLRTYLNELKASWIKTGYASKDQQERAYAQAVATLTRFYEQTAAGPVPLHVEQPFSVELEPEGIALRGRYDVVLEEDGIEIRDYKTSISVKTAEKAKQRATASTQLTLYALAWQLANGDLPARLSLQFVDTDILGSVRKTQRGIDGLRTRLEKAAGELRQGIFNPGPKHDYCLHPPL